MKKMKRFVATIGSSLFGKQADNVDGSMYPKGCDGQEEASGNNRRRAVLFLDIDGVLHVCDQGTLDHLPAFEAMMNMHPQIDIVISSDWRCIMPAADLMELFSEGFRSRVKGFTPDLGTMSRHPEVMAYVSENGITQWLAVDDRSELFPRECDYLFVVDRYTGLNQEWMHRLSEQLSMLTDEG